MFLHSSDNIGTFLLINSLIKGDFMGKRYPALQTISFLFKLLALIVLLFGIIHIICVILVSADIITYQIHYLPLFLSTLPYAMIPLFICLLLALILWAFSELIICLVDIEYNTRQLTQKSVNESTVSQNNISPILGLDNQIKTQSEQRPKKSQEAHEQSKLVGQIHSSPISENQGYTEVSYKLTKEPKTIKPPKPKVKRSFALKATLKNIFNKKLW
jgi:hypothetical protein